jgi:hypothetical protein
MITSNQVPNGFGWSWFMTFLVFFLAGSDRIPGVNESHYWAKAMHAWNPTWGGPDFFLSSPDTHWLFYRSVGAFTLLPLSQESTLWIARGLQWGFQALAWSWMIRPITGSPWWIAGTAAAFLSWVRFFHLSGEWVAGGVEAKGFAYAWVWLSLGCALRQRWSGSLWSGGIATAFHVLVGGWYLILLAGSIGLSLVRSGAWKRISLRWREVPALPVAGVLGGAVLGIGASLVGLLPALLQDRASSLEDRWMAPWIYVYDRLPHHLAPTQFTPDRWAMHLIGLALSWGIWRFANRCTKAHSPISRVAGWLAGMTLMAHLLTVTAYLIDLLTNGRLELLAAQWLRFYWCRWEDIAPGLLLAVSLGRLGSLDSTWLGSKDPVSMLPRQSLKKEPSELHSAAFRLLLLALSLMGWIPLVLRLSDPLRDRVAPADRMLLQQPATPDTASLDMAQWRAVCLWAKEHTSPDSLWITPRYQSTFLWYAGRGEYVNQKNIPQDAGGLVEWQKRMASIYGPSPRGGRGQVSQLSWSEAEAWGVDFILLDRRDNDDLPLWPLAYPLEPHRNERFMVFRISRGPRSQVQ